MNIKMADVFTSTTGVCIHVNLSCLHDFMNDGVTPFDMIDKAVSEYDENQVLIAKQDEQIKMLREALMLATPYLPFNAAEEEKAYQALEATKEQA